MSLDSDQIAALDGHYELLLRWNRKMNLTTVVKLTDAAIRHYCESLFVAAHLSGGAVVDIGSGAGFPGIPVAVARRDCTVDLVESNKRKAVFLREATRSLANVRVISERAEVLRDRRYNWLISRAVDPIELQKLRLAERFAILLGSDDAHLLKPDGVLPIPWGNRRVLAIGDVSRET